MPKSATTSAGGEVMGDVLVKARSLGVVADVRITVSAPRWHCLPDSRFQTRSYRPAR